jgi:hypothetical protein
MATAREITTTLAGLQSLPGQVDTCKGVVRALIETGQVWHQTSIWQSPTDCDRAREQVMDACGRLFGRLRKVRRTSLSPAAIRAQDYVAKIRACCAFCPKANADRARSGGFRCVVEERFKARGATAPRFRLGPDGEILETQ